MDLERLGPEAEVEPVPEQGVLKAEVEPVPEQGGLATVQPLHRLHPIRSTRAAVETSLD